MRTVRRYLMGLFLFGLVGTALELVLLGHYDGAWQLVPLIVIGAACVTALWLSLRPSPVSLRVWRAMMVVFLLSGALGIALHYRGNLEFQLEFDAHQSRSALFWKVMRAKAPPALAPGVMMQLGVLGLIYGYRHPAAARTGGAN